MSGCPHGNVASTCTACDTAERLRLGQEWLERAEAAEAERDRLRGALLRVLARLQKRWHDDTPFGDDEDRRTVSVASAIAFNALRRAGVSFDECVNAWRTPRCVCTHEAGDSDCPLHNCAHGSGLGDCEACTPEEQREHERRLIAGEPTPGPAALDLDLLRKLADGDGGARTGALKKAGLLEWRVTDAGRRALGLPTCTGLTARWCPVHGNCNCNPIDDGMPGEMDDESCPLHAVRSAHAPDEEPATARSLCGACQVAKPTPERCIHDGPGEEPPQ